MKKRVVECIKNESKVDIKEELSRTWTIDQSKLTEFKEYV